jgi:hypothetical protein
MRTYIIAVRNFNKLESVLAITDHRRKAVKLIADLEREDKYLGLYEPHRYTIIVSKAKASAPCEIVRTI